MSQREYAGSSRPPLAIPSPPPVAVAPEPASCACLGNRSSRERIEPSGSTPVSDVPGESFQSRADGIVTAANVATSSRFSMCPRARLCIAFSGLLCSPPRLGGIAFGVGTADSAVTAAKSGPFARIASMIPPPDERTHLSARAAVGVGTAASEAAIPSVRPNPLPFLNWSLSSSRRSSHRESEMFLADASGVGTEENAVPTVRRTDARSRQYGRPEGVADTFHVSLNSVEPRDASRARNLLPKDSERASLADETEPGGPEVSRVGVPALLARRGERLTGTASGPNGSVVWNASESERVGPASDAGEEVRGSVSDLLRLHILDAPFVNQPFGHMALCGEFAEPRSGGRVVLVVPGHSRSASVRSIASASPTRMRDFTPPPSGA